MELYEIKINFLTIFYEYLTFTVVFDQKTVVCLSMVATGIRITLEDQALTGLLFSVDIGELLRLEH